MDRDGKAILSTPVLFFDGDCHLCNGSVRVLLKLDRNRRLRYAPLRGYTAADRLGVGYGIGNGDTPASFVYFDGHAVSLRFRAVLNLLQLLYPEARLFWKLLSAPPMSWLGDIGYRLVAFGRYYVFGRAEYCAIGSRADREYFLP